MTLFTFTSPRRRRTCNGVRRRLEPAKRSKTCFRKTISLCKVLSCLRAPSERSGNNICCRCNWAPNHVRWRRDTICRNNLTIGKMLPAILVRRAARIRAQLKACPAVKTLITIIMLNRLPKGRAYKFKIQIWRRRTNRMVAWVNDFSPMMTTGILSCHLLTNLGSS